jgi:hypothetical protein
MFLYLERKKSRMGKNSCHTTFKRPLEASFWHAAESTKPPVTSHPKQAVKKNF